MNKKKIISIIMLLLIIVCFIITMIIFSLIALNKNSITENAEETNVIRVTDNVLFFTVEDILNKSIKNVDKVFIKDLYTTNIEEDNNIMVYIYANIWSNDYTENKNSYIEMNINKQELLYNLKIKKENINQKEYEKIIKKIKTNANNNQINIKYSASNTFTFAVVDIEDIVKRNIEYYKIIAINSPKEAYGLLDNNYKQKRFETAEVYFEYLDKTKDILKNTEIVKALKKENKYLGIDNKGNYYIMAGETIYDFKLQLDNYTLESEQYLTEYKNFNETKKAQVCATKVIKMINSKDYKNVYNFVEETYKANNFANIEDFIKYLKDNYYDYNIVDTVQVISNTKYYICEIALKNGDDAFAPKKILKMLVQIGENTDFKISFVK